MQDDTSGPRAASSGVATEATDLTRRELVDQLMKMGATALAAAMEAGAESK